MLQFLKKILKRKQNKEGLARAQALGLISEKEMLLLDLQRIKEKLENLEEKTKKK